MNDRRKLQPIDAPGTIDPSWKKWQFPVRPRDPARQGDIDFVCPHCGELLVTGTAGNVDDIPPTECPRCHQWSTGHGLRPRPSSKET